MRHVYTANVRNYLANLLVIHTDSPNTSKYEKSKDNTEACGMVEYECWWKAVECEARQRSGIMSRSEQNNISNHLTNLHATVRSLDELVFVWWDEIGIFYLRLLFKRFKQRVLWLIHIQALKVCLHQNISKRKPCIKWPNAKMQQETLCLIHSTFLRSPMCIYLASAIG